MGILLFKQHSWLQSRTNCVWDWLILWMKTQMKWTQASKVIRNIFWWFLLLRDWLFAKKQKFVILCFIFYWFMLYFLIGSCFIFYQFMLYFLSVCRYFISHLFMLDFLPVYSFNNFYRFIFYFLSVIIFKTFYQYIIWYWNCKLHSLYSSYQKYTLFQKKLQIKDVQNWISIREALRIDFLISIWSINRNQISENGKKNWFFETRFNQSSKNHLKIDNTISKRERLR